MSHGRTSFEIRLVPPHSLGARSMCCPPYKQYKCEYGMFVKRCVTHCEVIFEELLARDLPVLSGRAFDSVEELLWREGCW